VIRTVTTNGYSGLIAGRYDAERLPSVSQWKAAQKEEVLSSVPGGKRVVILHF
jgi:hypothetical protein